MKIGDKVRCKDTGKIGTIIDTSWLGIMILVDYGEPGKVSAYRYEDMEIVDENRDKNTE